MSSLDPNLPTASLSPSVKSCLTTLCFVSAHPSVVTSGAKKRPLMRLRGRGMNDSRSSSHPSSFFAPFTTASEEGESPLLSPLVTHPNPTKIVPEYTTCPTPNATSASSSFSTYLTIPSVATLLSTIAAPSTRARDLVRVSQRWRVRR